MNRYDEAIQFFKTLFGTEGTEIRLIHPRTKKVISYFGNIETKVDYEQIQANNEVEGYGVFALINKGNEKAFNRIKSGEGSIKDQHIESIRALFVEIDSEEQIVGDNLERLEEAALHPSIIVQSSTENKLHAYWLLADGVSLDEFTSFQEQLIQHFKASTESKNLSRVMRVPGFFHTKAEPMLSRLLHCEDVAYTRAELIEAFNLDPELKSKGSASDYQLPENWQPDSAFEAELLSKAKEQANKVEHGGRHKKLFWFAFACQDNRVEQARANKLIKEFVGMLPKYDDPVTLDEALKVVSWAYKERRPEQPWNVITLRSSSLLWDFKRTDFGNAERFIARHGDDVRFCPSVGWYVWDGTRWQPDDFNKVTQLFKQMVRDMYKECIDIEDEESRKGAVKFVTSLENKTRCINALSFASTEPSITVDVNQFDSDKTLLNCLNGTIELSTGTLREFRRNDLITKIAPVEYDAAASCPNWLKFLEAITKTNKEVDNGFINYKQMAYGYSLTGLTVEHALFIQYGSGANGKSTELEVMRSLMGDYAMQAEFDTFMNKRDAGVRNDIARLKGARFVTASEGEAGGAFAESVVKRITGGDRITARFLNKEFFEFDPEFKVWLATNHKPRVKGSDEGIWRRIKLMPYEHTVPAEERDKHLKAKLLAERSGILAWAVRGAVAYLVGKALPDSQAILNATNSYRDDMDVFSVFLDEYFLRGDEYADRFVSRKDLRYLYMHFCKENGEYSLSNKALINELSKRGFSQSARAGIRGFKGLVLSEEANQALKPSGFSFSSSS